MDEETKPKKPGPIRAGYALPKDFTNPKIGTLEHRCVNLRGKYAPDWVQLMVQKTMDVPDTLKFHNPNHPRPLTLMTDTWADVPRWIYENLTGCVEEVVKQDPDATPLTHDHVPHEIIERQRFHVQMIPSA